jgi:hypothetical protein
VFDRPLEMQAPDLTGTSFLVMRLGPDVVGAQLAAWARAAASRGPVAHVAVPSFEEGRPLIDAALDRARTGVRILVVGGRFDVQQTSALVRAHGASAEEIATAVTHERDAAVYCVHCRDVQRLTPLDGFASCPGCGRTLEIYDNLSSHRGSYLAADADARAV